MYFYISVIRTSLIEIGPCQPGFNNSNNIFQENESGKKFAKKRSLNRLKLLKTYLCSTMTEGRPSNLVILSIESNIAQTIDFNNIVICKFALMKKRRKLL